MCHERDTIWHWRVKFGPELDVTHQYSVVNLPLRSKVCTSLALEMGEVLEMRLTGQCLVWYERCGSRDTTAELCPTESGRIIIVLKAGSVVQGSLTHKKHPPPRTLQQEYT